ncbi:MAG TPA: helix-turn-helix transcriptional regulator [Trebonia sp.]|jgi:transcriptional regulator with XRE-family HTH domain|nr:helix-turn-helix transcriptional regulator [Trebonia sp.]
MRQFSARSLRDARQHAGLSREQAAVAARVSISSLTGYEQARTQPSLNAAARLAATFGVTVDDLLDAPQAGEVTQAAA